MARAASASGSSAAFQPVQRRCSGGCVAAQARKASHCSSGTLPGLGASSRSSSCSAGMAARA